MDDKKKTKAQLIKELEEFRKLNAELRTAEAERKKAEELLQKEKNYSQYIIDSSLDMIISVDKNRHIVEFNKIACETFGYTKEEIIGKHAKILYAKKKAGTKVFNTTRLSGVFKNEVLNKRKNGEMFLSYLSGSIIKDTDGDVIGYMGVSRDITDLKKAEKSLKGSED